MEVDDRLDGVRLAPDVPEGWTVTGAPATADALRLGQTLSGTWTITSPPGQDVSTVDIHVTAEFAVLGRSERVVEQVEVRPRPDGRVFMREAEDSRNRIGSAGITNCARCSGGEEVRNLGGGPNAHVEVKVGGIGNTEPRTAAVRVALAAGNTIRIHNDGESAPDLDRLSLGGWHDAVPLIGSCAE